jgi:hypothetical protein
MGISELKELCRSYNIPRWPKVRKIRQNSDVFQCFSVKERNPPDIKPQSISKQTKKLTINLEKKCIKFIFIQENNHSKIKPALKKKIEGDQLGNLKMSIFNLCNNNLGV